MSLDGRGKEGQLILPELTAAFHPLRTLALKKSIVRAPKAATVKATPARAGDSLAVDQVIVEFE
jgi:hypothetical protein